MTRDEILTMEAGAEMDALVATKVMGWIQASTQSSVWLTWYPPGEHSKARLSPPPFSTDIAAAWEVVKRIIGTTKRCPQVRWISEAMSHEWHCDMEWGAEAYAPTAPLAICRAALIAVMEER